MTAPLTLARRIDPRLHLSAAIGWAVFAVVTLAALAAATLASAEAEGRARADAQALLGEFATQVRDALSLQIEARRSLLLATAAQLGSLSDRSPSTQLRVLEAAQLQVRKQRAGALQTWAGGGVPRPASAWQQRSC